MATKLSDIGEFGFIKRISKDMVLREAGVILGIGDDASVFEPRADRVMVLTTDMLVEGVHFDLEYTSFTLLGRKTLAVNLSDIAAMGAEPQDAYVCIAVPERITLEDLDALYEGLRGMALEHSVNILGGDTTRSPGPLVMSVALTGSAFEGQVVLRSGARPGDLIYVTGCLGEAPAGLDMLRQKRSWPRHEGEELLRAHLDPRPHVAEGIFLAREGFATSMIDLSDGLASDLRHICERSGVGAVIHEESLPVSRSLRQYADQFCLDLLPMILGGGEDYCLLLTVPPERGGELEGSFQRLFGRAIWRIGEIVSRGELLMLTSTGELRPLPKAGWDSFESPRTR